MKWFVLGKYAITLFFVSLIFMGCDKFKTGEIHHKVRFTSHKLKEKRSEKDSFYSSEVLGAYITSITPRRLNARLNILMYLDNWDQQGENTHMISYVDGHDNDPNYNIYTDVDFTDNQLVEYTPILYSKDKRDGIFEQAEVTFNYLLLAPTYFSQEIELPKEYGSVKGGVLDTLTGKRIWTTNHQILCEAIFGYPNQQPWAYFFGNCDSTYLVHQDKVDHSISEEYPFGEKFIIRSNAFSPITVKMPTSGQTIEMYSTIGFDSENLIQVYAGKDNVPYTQDDVFVYAPKFWERLYVNLEVN
jgi:hypothetical protein